MFSFPTHYDFTCHSFTFHHLAAPVCRTVVLLASLSLLPAASYAQDEPFLACAEFSNRDARISCLETALETAVKNRDAATTAQARTGVTTPAARSSATAVTPAPVPVEATVATEPRDQKLFGLFGREREEESAKPVDTLQASVAKLEYYKPDVLTITLDNGQVWRQSSASRFNLQKDDAVRIYATRWGKNYRLEAERFNGYIQVSRIR